MALYGLDEFLREVDNAFGDAYGAVDFLVDQFSQPRAQQAGRNLMALIQALWNWLRTFFGLQLGAWQFSHPQVVGAAWGLGDTSYAAAAAWNHLLNVIIPHSLSWLDGKVHVDVHNYVDPKFDLLDISVVSLDAFRADIDVWRQTWVDPQLATDLGYRQFLQGWPQAQWFRWKDYFDRPELFANWAVPVLLAPLVRALASRANQPDLLALLTELIQASPDRFRYVERAALAILESPWP